MSWNWDAPPGVTTTRRTARKILVSFIVGALSLGAAWAGTGLTPVSDEVDETVAREAPLPEAKADKNFLAQAGGDKGGDEGDGAPAAAYSPADLQPGQILGGSAKVSLFPRPEDYQAQFPGARWETNQKACETLAAPSQESVSATATHVADFRVRWAENSDCIYMGGYGIGPMNAIGSWDDEYGLWARSVAMQDAQGDALVLTLIDAVYWEAFYSNMCPRDPCGFLDLADQLAAETGLKPESFVFASTHSHTAMDFIGGWGGVPDWYMQQATDSIKASATHALNSMEPAILETGETILRTRNGERRDFYRSAEDDTFSWFRLIDADNQPTPEICTTPTPTWMPPGKAKRQPPPQPICEPASPGRAIATVGAYAAHPVTADAGPGRADADFPAVFAKRVEEEFGGTGMFLQTGLGNMSPRGNKVEMGNGLADQVPDMGTGVHVADTDLRVGRAFWDQPVTNAPLGSLGVAGFFDREFNQTPAMVSEGKGGEENKKCRSASPVSVRTSVSAAKIGSLWITGGPGELFANLTNTIEERNPNGVTLALGLVNDGLGYIIQSFETDHVGRQGVGFAGKAGPVGLSEYEDAYSIDHCFGDATLEQTLRLLGRL